MIWLTLHKKLKIVEQIKETNIDSRIRVIIFITFITSVILYLSIQRIRLNINGVYVIGERYEVVDGGRNASSSHFRFHLRGKEYNCSIRDGGGKMNARMFILALPKNPKVNMPYTDVDVPKCFTLKDVPYEGWNSIPPDTCQD